MLKILQARLQKYVNCELPDVQAVFRKGRGTRDQIASICWIIKKAKDILEGIYFCFIDYTMEIRTNYGVTTNYGKFLNENMRPPYLSPEKPMQVRKQQLVLDMEQWIGSKLGKGNVKAVYCHLAYLSSVQSTSCE